MLRQTISGLGYSNFQIWEEICLFNQWPRSHITGVSRKTCNTCYCSSMMCWDPMRYTRRHLARFRACGVVGSGRYLLDFPLFSSLRAEHGPGECHMSAIYGGLYSSMCGHRVCMMMHGILYNWERCLVVPLLYPSRRVSDWVESAALTSDHEVFVTTQPRSCYAQWVLHAFLSYHTIYLQ